MPKPDRTSRSLGFDPGGCAPAIAAFEQHLRQVGHTSRTIENYTHSARHLACWANGRGLPLEALCAKAMRRFGAHRCRCSGGKSRAVSRLSLARAERFLRHATGLDGQSAAPRRSAMTPLLAGFEGWQREHRGLSEKTIDSNSRQVVQWLRVIGEDPRVYDHVGLRQAIMAQATVWSPVAMKRSISALRGYLRYLTFRGLCQPGLAGSLPGVAHWRLSALPRYLPAAQLEVLLASCHQPLPAGRRDRAVLLLLARLGLRAGDIVALRLADIDWAEGRIRVCGKGRREVLLPLCQEVGDAIFDYVEHARPSSASDHLFLRAIGPHRPLGGSSAVSLIVRHALDRASIVGAPGSGAHMLRHSAATAMLRGGETLEAVGAILRHASIDSTAHYAKVDVPMLSAVAQPWPGSCAC